MMGREKKQHVALAHTTRRVLEAHFCPLLTRLNLFFYLFFHFFYNILEINKT